MSRTVRTVRTFPPASLPCRTGSEGSSPRHGFARSRAAGQGGIIAHGAKLLYAFAGATAPEATGINRKACGGAHDVIASKHIGVDDNLAFPTAELAIMGPEGAVSIVYRSEIQRAADPAAARARIVGDDKAKFATPYKAAELGFIDEVICPRMLRTRLARALDLPRDKRDKNPPTKHGNIPL
ncbi:carboxyl transferase domain-containing protein [Sorangium sp. So ce204]|uniref:carboxyl transferase domain-containing protein n=1 Tax=Sorangium sp. So ce204 TaxID=3133288 RepID=UPI003F610E67